MLIGILINNDTNHEGKEICMKKVFLVMSLMSVVLSIDLQAQISLVKKSKITKPQTTVKISQSDINNAFRAVSNGDYGAFSKIIKKYSDLSSIKTLLTATPISLVATGRTLLHDISGLANVNVALKMGILVVNTALNVSSQFPIQVISAKDVNGKTPTDYAKEKNNTQLISIFNGIIGAGTSTSTTEPTQQASTTEESSQASTTTPLQNDTNTAFQKIASSDYMGMSSLVKKYTDAASVQAMLTAVQDGKTLLQAAANVENSTIAIQMVARITGQAMQVGRDFQLQILRAQDSQGKTALDYATSRGNTQLVDLLNQMLRQ